ncbi:MAG: hypothetical protein ACYTEY_03575, partial [Planctomycetota bacterium]
MRTSLHTLIVAAMLAAWLPSMASAAGGSEFKLKARLFGDTIVSGQVVYLEKDRGRKGLERRFKVQVEEAQPGEAFDVFVNDDFAGTITANSLGRAKLQLRTRKFIDEPRDGEPMPRRFPRLQQGDVVMVGALTGVFFDESRDAGGRVQRFRLRGDLEGDPGLEGNAKYIERFKNGRLMRRFKVEIENAEPGEVFDIHVNGAFVGEIVINDLDEGRLELRTPAFIDDPDDGEPMP